MQITLHRGGMLLVRTETKFSDLIIPSLLTPLVASPLSKPTEASVSPSKKGEYGGNPEYACKGHTSHF